MDIDQRLEALTQTVELIAAMQHDNEARWEKRFGEVTAAIQANSENIQKDGENIRALARVAEIHHERLTRLEG
jgi:hypothetical protein